MLPMEPSKFLAMNEKEGEGGERGKKKKEKRKEGGGESEPPATSPQLRPLPIIHTQLVYSIMEHSSYLYHDECSFFTSHKSLLLQSIHTRPHQCNVTKHTHDRKVHRRKSLTKAILSNRHTPMQQLK